MNGTSDWLIKLTLLSKQLHEKERPLVDEEPRPKFTPAERKQTVVGRGNISREPIDKQAAMLLAKAHWLSEPPPISLKPDEEKETSAKKSKKRPVDQARAAQAKQTHQTLRHCAKVVKQMEKTMSAETREGYVQAPAPGRHGEYISEKGIRIKMVDGQPMFDMDSVSAFLIREIPKLVPDMNPMVQGAKDARAIINELLHGIGGEMDEFKLKCKDFLEDVRQTRMAVVAETSSMTRGLRDVRQFFLGHDYEQEITRLREFVDLCERLNALKESGFLDKVADTMLTLSVNTQ